MTDLGAVLSPRERETCAHLLDGCSYKEAAARMQLSIHTVRQYGKAIYRKLGVGSQAQLQARWIDRVRRAAVRAA